MLRQKIIDFVTSEKQYPLLTGLASGLYALLYLYDKNFKLVNSWPQFFYCLAVFCVLPALVFYLSYHGLNKTKKLERFRPFLLSVLNLVFFAIYIVWITQGLHKKKMLLGSIVIAVVIGIVLHKHVKKIVAIQLLLACFVALKLIPNVYDFLKSSNAWQTPNDGILEARFVQKPNIYFLQPDGYVNFSEINRGYYNFDNREMKSFLENKNFMLYDAFRSNYTSTVASNSSMFSMKHHFYGFDENDQELYHTRSIIAGNNPVIDILENNDYKTHLILDHTYLIINRPELKYDFCNISYSELPFLTKGFDEERDTWSVLKFAMDHTEAEQNFYFIRQPKPGHVHTEKSRSLGVKTERNMYLDAIKSSNVWIQRTVNLISENDPNALVIISSDHGGFVGFEYTRQAQTKTEDTDLLSSMFSTILAIRWPHNVRPEFDDSLKSSVNLFRIVTAHLSENPNYLEALEPDDSYALWREGRSMKVYKIFDDDGKAVLKNVVD